MEATAELTEAVKNVPALRFPEFEGEWEEDKLDKLVEFKSGGTPSMKHPEYWDGKIPWISASSMVGKYFSRSDRTISELGLANGSKLAPKGSLLLLVRGSMLFNKIPVGIAERDVSFNQDVKALITKEASDTEFIYQWFSAKQHQLLNIVTGTGIGAGKLDTEELKNMKVHLPSIVEQQKVTSFLSAADDKIQQLSNKKELLEKYKKGVMQQIFSQQIRFKDDNGNDFPEWEESCLGDIIVDLSSGVSVNSEDRNIESEDGYGILKTSCISSGKFYSFENKKIIDNELTRAKLNPVADTILISRMNTPQLVGESGYVSVDYPNLFVPDRLWLASTDSSKACAKWLSYFLTTGRTRSVLTNIATGTSGSMKNISKPNFLNIRTWLPTIAEQDKIVCFLTSIDNKLNYTIEQLEQAQQFKKGLLQQLFV